jgi:hypothetical protein
MKPLFPIEKLRNTSGVMLTQSLFYEFSHMPACTDPVYTLKEFDYKGCKSMRQIYINLNSEYEASQVLLGSWEHWAKLKKIHWFSPFAEAWEAERKLREISMAKKILLEEAENGSVSAAKTIYEQDKTRVRGRPSNQEKKKSLKNTEELDDFINQAMAKIVPIESGKKSK